MVLRIVGVIAAVIAILFLSGVRVTTEAKQDVTQAELEQLRDENVQLHKDLQNLEERYQDLLERQNTLIEYFEQQGQVPKASVGPSRTDVIRVPGSSGDNDDGDDETRIIERENNNTVPMPSTPDNDNDEPIVEVPNVPELPDIPGAVGDILEDTPIGGIL